MSIIEQAFAKAAAEGRLSVITYLTVGYPSPAATEQLALAAIEGGADIVELGIPFSDPLADGATVQRASQVALAQGVNLETCLRTAAAIRGSSATPLILMGYFNPIYRFGIDSFAGACASEGINGLIVPDLPPEEAAELRQAARQHGLDLVFLVAPNSTDERLARIAAQASGFVYCVALAGTTGARESLAGGLRSYLSRVRRYTRLPLAVGFGISRPQHVAELASFADGAIVGSALIDLIDHLPPLEQAAQVREFVTGLRDAARKPSAAQTFLPGCPPE